MSNTNERNAEVIKAVKENPDLTYAEISELFNLKPHQVAILANKAGIFRRQRVANVTQDDTLDEKIHRLECELSEARRQQVLTQVRFEREGSKVAVYGLGTHPLVAEYKDWLRFLRKNGAAMLREFISAQFGSANGNGTVQ